MIYEEEIVPRERPADTIHHRVTIKDDYVETMNLRARSTEHMEEVIMIERTPKTAESTVSIFFSFDPLTVSACELGKVVFPSGARF